MKKSLLIILMATLTINVSAQNAHEKVLKLFKLMELDKTMNAMSGNMMNVFSKNPNMFPGDKDQKKLKELAAFSQSEIKKLQPKITADMVPIYEKYFTQQEIQKYIDFYSTPEGKKLAGSAAVLQKQMLGNMMTKYMPQLQKNIAVKMQELRSRKWQA